MSGFTYGSAELCLVVVAWPHVEDLVVTMDSLLRQQATAPFDVVVVSVGGNPYVARLVDSLRSLLRVEYAHGCEGLSQQAKLRAAVLAGVQSSSKRAGIVVLQAGDVASDAYVEELCGHGCVRRRCWRVAADGCVLTPAGTDFTGVQCQLVSREQAELFWSPYARHVPEPRSCVREPVVSHFGEDWVSW